MKYKGTNNNIYSSDNFDLEFVEYLYSLPAEFIDELFMIWVMMKNKKTKNISTLEIYKLSKALDTNKVDLTKIFKDKL